MMDDKIKTSAEAFEADTLPRRHEVRIDGGDETPIPEGLAKTAVQKKSPAEWAYARLILYIQKFEETLDNEHEAAMGFAGGHQGVLRIEGMGYFDPDIITFYGSDPSGEKAQLVQHVSQLNVMLRAMPKLKKTEAPQRIGFRLAQDLEKG